MVNGLAIPGLRDDGANVGTHEFVEGCHGVLQHGIEARPVEIQVSAVKLQTQPFRFLDQPVEGLVRQAVGGVASADVGVDPGKPGLLEVAVPALRPRPDIRRERLAPFVDGQGVIGVLDFRAQADVVVLILVFVEYLASIPGAPSAPTVSQTPMKWMGGQGRGSWTLWKASVHSGEPGPLLCS